MRRGWAQKQQNELLGQLELAEKLQFNKMADVRNFEPKSAPFGLLSKVDTGRDKNTRDECDDEVEDDGDDSMDDDVTTQPGQIMDTSVGMGLDSPIIGSPESDGFASS